MRRRPLHTLAKWLGLAEDEPDELDVPEFLRQYQDLDAHLDRLWDLQRQTPEHPVWDGNQ